LVLALVLSQFLYAGGASAQVPAAGLASGFEFTGFLQAATLGPGTTVPAPNVGPGVGAHQGGTLTVNGHLIVVPSETIVILPANQLTWAELFSQAPAPYAGTIYSGLALSDVPAPLATYEIHVIGNRVGDTYIAGIIDLWQQQLNQGQGYINLIDYALGEMRVGGIMNDPNCVATGVAPAGGALCSGARVRINDPIDPAIGTGRFSRGLTVALNPDQRFMVDQGNPTIRSGTGYPMCLPRVTSDPTVAGAADDPLCPQRNRTKDTTGAFLGIVGMPAPPAPATGPDPTLQAPFEVGDYITFSGNLVSDQAPATVGPFNPLNTYYILAHTITSNIAIYTTAGSDPAYVAVDTMLMGTGGITAPFVTEAAFRTRFEGMTTDPSRRIHLYARDFAAGVATPRDFGTIGVDQGAPTGAVKGRWRFRPPCLAFGTVPTKPDKQCVMNASGVFDPAPRELLAVLETTAGIPSAPLLVANGLTSGSYFAPIQEFIFPEQVVGSPVPPNNFDSMTTFLAFGGYFSTAGTIAGQLNPWPGTTVPNAAAVAPPPAPTATTGDVTIASLVYRLAKQRFVVTATSSLGTNTTLFLQLFDVKGKPLNATQTPQQMVPVLGIPTLDVVGNPFPGLVVVTSSAGGLESINLTQLPFPLPPTSANIGTYTVIPVQPGAPAVPIVIRSN
jgi:hypothetical protein